MKQWLFEKFNIYAPFVIGGLIGAIVQRMRKAMSFKRFLATLFVSAFVGFVVGILLKNYLNVNDEIVFAFCSISGVFSQEILDEAQEIIGYISSYVKNLLKLNKKDNESTL